MINLNTPKGNWILLLLVSFIWGSPFILRQIALESFAHQQVAALQIFISFVLFIPLIIKNLKKLTRKNALLLLLSGLSGNVGPSFFYAKAQTQINSSLAGMLNALLPTITLLIAMLLYRVKPNLYSVLGVIVGLSGTLVLALMGNSFGTTYFWGIFYVLMAILSIAVSINLVSFALPNLTGIEIASLAFLFVGPMAGIYLFQSDLLTPLNSSSILLSSAMITLLGTFTFVGVILNNQLIKQSSHVFAASIAYLIPIVALFWGLVIGGDKISLLQLACIAIIFVGVHLANKKS